MTIEYISIRTGIPVLLIEDELPRFEYVDAVYKNGNKYATNFIILRLEDRKLAVKVSAQLVIKIADEFERLLHKQAAIVKQLDFYGHDFGLNREETLYKNEKCPEVYSMPKINI